jgi:hypothetical protein
VRSLLGDDACCCCCHCLYRFEAITLSNLLIKVALMPLTIITQKEGPKMAVRRRNSSSSCAAHLRWQLQLQQQYVLACEHCWRAGHGA